MCSQVSALYGPYVLFILLALPFPRFIITSLFLSELWSGIIILTRMAFHLHLLRDINLAGNCTGDSAIVRLQILRIK